MASQGPIRPEFRYCFDAGEVIGAIEGVPLREPVDAVWEGSWEPG